MMSSFSEHGQHVYQGSHWLTGLLLRTVIAEVCRISDYYVPMFNLMIISITRALGSWRPSLHTFYQYSWSMLWSHLHWKLPEVPMNMQRPRPNPRLANSESWSRLRITASECLARYEVESEHEKNTCWPGNVNPNHGEGTGEGVSGPDFNFTCVALWSFLTVWASVSFL